MMGGAMAKYLSPLWYVIDSWPMIIAPPNGSGTAKQIHIHNTLSLDQDIQHSRTEIKWTTSFAHISFVFFFVLTLYLVWPSRPRPPHSLASRGPCWTPSPSETLRRSSHGALVDPEAAHKSTEKEYEGETFSLMSTPQCQEYKRKYRLCATSPHSVCSQKVFTKLFMETMEHLLLFKPVKQRILM